MFVWISSHKAATLQINEGESKKLINNSITELDLNLRKQWPRKGKLEVEVYQERKGQITQHNKKYERQVRSCIDRHMKGDEVWNFLVEAINEEF